MSEHHIVWRSRGGTDGPTIAICNECHAILNGEKQGGAAWDVVEYSATAVVVADRHSGEVVIERYFDSAFDQGDYIASLDHIEGHLADALEDAKYLDEEGLNAAWQATRHFSKGIWIYQAELIYWAVKHIPYGDKTRKVAAVAKEMGFGRSKGMELLQLREALPGLSAHAESLVTDKPSLLREAVRSPEPERAFELLEERLIAQPDVSVRAFRDQLKGADIAVEYHSCPDCGQSHVKKVDA